MLPSQEYLAAINAGLADPNALAAQALGVGPMPPGAPAAGPPPTAPPSFIDQAGAAFGKPPPGTIDNSALANGPITVVPPTPPPGAPPPAGPPAGPPPPPAGPPVAGPPPGPPAPSEVPFPLRAVKTAGAPARDVDLRSKQLKEQQAKRDETITENAIGDAAAKSQVAQEDIDLAAQQVDEARAREEEAEGQENLRRFELAQRQMDFDQTAQSLAKQAPVNPNRWWASRNTGEKVGAMVSLFLGGFMQGFRGGGPNPAMDIINRYIDNDVRAQEMAYAAKKDSLAAKQSAYGMAMQKFGSAEAARAAATKAAWDVTQAAARGIAAKYKGVDAMQALHEIEGRIEERKADEDAKYIAHVQATGPGVQWVDQNGVPYNAAQAREVAKETRGANQKRDEVAYDTASKLTVEGAKAQTEQQKKLTENQVRLPDGSVISAPNEKEAGALRDLATSYDRTRALTEKARQIRSSATWRADPKQRDLLRQTQTDLMQQYAVQHKMGALSDKDYDQALSGTANLFGLGSGVESNLDALNQKAAAELQSRVRTIPGAAPKAGGAMPSSFTPHGGK